MRVNSDSLLGPFRMSEEEARSDSLSQWVVPPLQIQRACVLSFCRQSQSGVDNGEELVRTGVCRIDPIHHFKCLTGAGNSAKTINRLSVLPLYFPIARILACNL